MELQRLLAQRACKVPLIMITGHGDISMAVSAVKAGAFDFIEKPIDDRHLAASIGEAIEQTRDKLVDQRQLAELVKRYAELSDRQREVMEFAIQGYPIRRSLCGWASAPHHRTLSRVGHGANAGEPASGIHSHGRPPQVTFAGCKNVTSDGTPNLAALCEGLRKACSTFPATLGSLRVRTRLLSFRRWADFQSRASLERAF